MDLSNPVRAIIPSLEGEVHEVLARTTLPLSASRVAKLARSGSAPGIRLALARLVHQGTVTVLSSSASPLYVANREHLLWPAIEEAVRAADRTLVELKSRLSALAAGLADPDRTTSVTLALFGSVARGDSESESDVDLLAVFPRADLTERDESFVDEVIARVPLWTGNQCNVYAITRDGLAELVRRKDPIVGSWIRESDTFHGPELRDMLGARPSQVGKD